MSRNQLEERRVINQLSGAYKMLNEHVKQRVGKLLQGFPIINPTKGIGLLGLR